MALCACFSSNGLWEFRNRPNNEMVALKIVKSARHYTEAARDEIEILKKVTDNDQDNSKCVVHLLDSFEHSGPNGNRTNESSLAVLRCTA